MQFHRPLRPYFYKPVAILGVPLRDWKISLAATVSSAVFFFFVWRTAFGIPVWFVLSLAIGLALVAFFLWAHNSHKRGWLEFTIRYCWRQLIGAGENRLPEKTGRKRTRWLIDDAGEKTVKPKWLERA